MDFLLSLPVPKATILLSKSLICLMVAAVIWGSTVLVIELFVVAEAHDVLNRTVRGTAVTGFTLFAVAWLFSVPYRGFAIPIGAGLVVIALLFFATTKYANGQDWSSDEYSRNFATCFYPTCFVTALCSFVAGWIAFLRRLEP